jgi:hypothetical protein
MTAVDVIQFLIIVLVLSFGAWELRRSRREVRRLGKELASAEATLHEFMTECEATFAALSRVVSRGRSSVAPNVGSPARSRILSSETAREKRAAAAASSPEPAAIVKAATAGKKSRVLELAEQGVEASAIASRLMIPQGEIDLILSLNKSL